MNIKTIEGVQNAINREKSWRVKELAFIKQNVNCQDKSELISEYVLRSSITMLYAHWEGAIKNIARIYLKHVAEQHIAYKDLKINFIALSLVEQVVEAGKSSKPSVHKKHFINVQNRFNENISSSLSNYIKTSSNLSSEIFVEIMEAIGICYDKYSVDFKLIDKSLLESRNAIAHGERRINIDTERYNKIHDTICSIINDFASSVLEAAEQKQYLAI